MKTTIFITGASSKLGSAVIKALPADFDIFALQNKTKIDDGLNKQITIVEGSLGNISKWEQNLSNIDTVIHLGAITHANDPKKYYEINYDGTKNLVDVCKRNGIKKFIFISTRSIGYCCGEYGDSKRKAEEYIENSGLNYTILRLSEVYDEKFSDKEGISDLFNLIKKYPVIPYLDTEDKLFSPIHIDDVIKAIVNITLSPENTCKTYTVTGPQNFTFRELLEKIEKYTERKIIKIPVTIFFAKIAFSFVSKFTNNSGDQLKRLLCHKEVSNIETYNELGINPRTFI